MPLPAEILDSFIRQTKVTVPRRRGDLLARPRLQDLFYELLESKLIILTSPPGYGKTSMLIDIASQGEVPFCWFTLDSLDTDIRRFLSHLIVSIATRFPGFGEQTMAILWGTSENDLPQETLITVLVNEISEHIREHFVVVLDDYHLVDKSQVINNFVSRFIQSVGENCHLVIVSRTLLPLPDLPLLVARAQVSGLGFQELAFKPEEIQALLMQNHRTALPSRTAEEIALETEGWITGVLLSTQSLVDDVPDQVRAARVSGVGLYDYMAQQILDQQPPDIREFLLKTSLLEEFNAGFCQAILGEPPANYSWQSLINEVMRSNLFALTVGEGGGWIRYHNLFQIFLQERASSEMSDQQSMILARMANYRAGKGEWDQAFTIFQRLGDTISIANWLEVGAKAMMKSGQYDLLVRWYDLLPPEEVITRPLLLARRGISAAYLGENHYGLLLLNHSIEMLEYESADDQLVGVLVWRGFVKQMVADYGGALKDVDAALSLLTLHPELDEEKGEAYRVKGLVYRKLGNLKEALRSFNLALEAFQRHNQVFSIARIYMELGSAYLDSCEYSKALASYQFALDFFQSQKNLLPIPNLLNDLGFLSHLRGDYRQAFRYYSEALEKVQGTGSVSSEAFILAGLGDLYMDLDAPDAAREAYRSSREIGSRLLDRFLLFYLNLAEAEVSRFQDNLASAHFHIDSANKQLADSGSEYEQALHSLQAGRVALAEQKYPQAVKFLDSASSFFERGGQRVEEAKARFLLAIAYYKAGKKEASQETMMRTLLSGSGWDILAPLVILARAERSLLEASFRNTRLEQLLRDLLERVDRFDQDLPLLRRFLRQHKTLVELGPPRLRIQALGRSQVSLDARAIILADWQTQKTRELFYLLLNQPGGVTKEVLGESWWPESSPSQLKLRFKNALYRLRHALHQEVVIYQDDRYAFNRSIDYEYDVEIFWERLSQAEKVDNRAHQRKLLVEAVEIYQGAYLPEVSEAWAIPVRERIYLAYVDACVKLSKIYLEERDFEAAVHLANKLISTDSCLEEAYCLAMKGYAGMGNRTAITRQYTRCLSALQEELGISPSRETKGLYQTLIG
jgi:LuxR family transcriptional regulator, maltose regulon positive regulatory protein